MPTSEVRRYRARERAASGGAWTIASSATLQMTSGASATNPGHACLFWLASAVRRGSSSPRVILPKIHLWGKNKKRTLATGFQRRRMCSRFLWFWFWRSEGSCFGGRRRRVRQPPRRSVGRARRSCAPFVGRSRATSLCGGPKFMRRARRACCVSGLLDSTRAMRTGGPCAAPTRSRVRFTRRGLCQHIVDLGAAARAVPNR
ncbi:MAG: hypothetical protein FD160_3456 [Caulobacteraceae bacterium]|nr:MAG: hypothetical protein FD160_3456 [Caulobacteraceae bacterium]